MATCVISNQTFMRNLYRTDIFIIVAALLMCCGPGRVYGAGCGTAGAQSPEAAAPDTTVPGLRYKIIGDDSHVPQFEEIPMTGKVPVEYFDFEIEKFIGEHYGESLFQGRYRRYGLPEFYRLKDFVKDTDTVCGIITTGYTAGGPNYVMYTRTDTLGYDIDSRDAGRQHKALLYTDSLTLYLDLTPIRQSIPFQLLKEGRIDELPEKYRFPFDGNYGRDYIIRLYVRDGGVARAQVMRIYDSRAAVCRTGKNPYCDDK